MLVFIIPWKEFHTLVESCGRCRRGGLVASLSQSPRDMWALLQSLDKDIKYSVEIRYVRDRRIL